MPTEEDLDNGKSMHILVKTATLTYLISEEPSSEQRSESGTGSANRDMSDDGKSSEQHAPKSHNHIQSL